MMLSDTKGGTFHRLESLVVSSTDSAEMPEVSSSRLSPLSAPSPSTNAVLASPAQAMEPSDFEVVGLEGAIWHELELGVPGPLVTQLPGLGGPPHHVRKILITAPPQTVVPAKGKSAQTGSEEERGRKREAGRGWTGGLTRGQELRLMHWASGHLGASVIE